MCACGPDLGQDAADWQLGAQLRSLPGRVEVRSEESWRGFDAWNIVAGRELFVRDDDGPIVVTTVAGRISTTDLDVDEDGYRRATRVEIAAGVDGFTAAKHEAGHVLGLDHLDSGIMWPKLNDEPVTEREVSLVRALYCW